MELYFLISIIFLCIMQEVEIILIAIIFERLKGYKI